MPNRAEPLRRPVDRSISSRTMEAKPLALFLSASLPMPLSDKPSELLAAASPIPTPSPRVVFIIKRLAPRYLSVNANMPLAILPLTAVRSPARAELIAEGDSDPESSASAAAAAGPAECAPPPL